MTPREIRIEDTAPAPADVQDIMACLIDLAFYRTQPTGGDLARAVAHELRVRVAELPEVQSLNDERTT